MNLAHTQITCNPSSIITSKTEYKSSPLKQQITEKTNNIKFHYFASLQQSTPL